MRIIRFIFISFFCHQWSVGVSIRLLILNIRLYDFSSPTTVVQNIYEPLIKIYTKIWTIRFTKKNNIYQNKIKRYPSEKRNTKIMRTKKNHNFSRLFISLFFCLHKDLSYVYALCLCSFIKWPVKGEYLYYWDKLIET